MIELTIKEMLDAGPAITKVMKTEGLPVKVAYRFAKLQKQFLKELKEFQDAQTKLYTDLGGKPVEAKESGMMAYHFEPENGKLVQEAVTELLNEVVQFEFLPLKLDEIGKLESVLTPDDYRLLEKLIVE